MTGPDPDGATVRTDRSVLAVVHSVTSMTRLLDALAPLEADRRVQVLFTGIPGATVPGGVAAFFADLEVRTLDWDEAVRREFDLAIAAASSGPLHAVQAPLLNVPHGAGYNKHLTRNPEPGTRNPEPGSPVYGLSREQLTHGGDVVPSVVVLSHEEQLERLAEQCPEAAERALVAGDPCFDRLVASVPWRDRYRAALGLRAGQRLVVASSTWGPDSLLGRRPELPARLLAELPADEYQVAAVIHPNVWHHHGPWQLRAWLADCRRAGLLVIPPREGWRAALVAADAVVGDHGSVTLYAAALGRPVLLGAFPAERVVPGTAMAALGAASALLGDEPISEQIGSVIGGTIPGGAKKVADAAFAVQGHSAEVLRSAMYRLLELAPPATPVRVPPVPPPRPEPRRWEDAERPALLAGVVIEQEPGRAVFTVERTPAETADLRTVPLRGHRHLVVDGTETDHRLRGLAGLLVNRHGTASGEADTAVAETGADGSCLLRLPDGRVLALRTAADVDPAVLASAVLAWLAGGSEPDALPPRLALRIGSALVPFACETVSA
ncbi:hypothetical protein [Actinomadura opuntiae]|uniref:hypothetical protein n=1 Tax=Actinomadura sp. OS1-43 TaxID=604315 RepID=UPI00255AC69D|nr:hypothetical protein [Actinomadura sp. OS1-43]MDL4813702.1 hypothetical protein [Actinomadura sp. OS1-43]